MTDADLVRRVKWLEERIKQHEQRLTQQVFTYTPAWTSASDPQPAIGSGTITGQYIRRGPMCLYQFYLLFAGDSTFGSGDWRISLPLTVSASAIGVTLGVAHLRDAATNNYERTIVLLPSATYATTFVQLDNGTNVNSITATAPFTWATADSLSGQIEYRV